MTPSAPPDGALFLFNKSGLILRKVCKLTGMDGLITYFKGLVFSAVKLGSHYKGPAIQISLAGFYWQVNTISSRDSHL